MFVIAINMLMAAIKLIRTCRTFHVLNLFVVSARLIDAEWTRVASAICVRKIMVLRVLNVEESDVIGALGGILRSARREFGHSPPKRITRAPRPDVARWRPTII